MPTLLRVNNKTINMDQVFEIDDHGDRIRIYYAVVSRDTAGMPQPAYAELEGEGAKALRRWIDRHAIDIGAGATSI